jgi:dipeptidyl aminopeptidase/acylaminoacyl peptidase
VSSSEGEPTGHAKSDVPNEDAVPLRRAGDPQVSPDGSMVAFVVSSIDTEENKSRSNIWVAQADGTGRARPFTSGPSDSTPRWSPDGRFLAFSSNPEDDPSQICVLPVDRGGERVVVSTWAAPASEIAWSPDGAQIAFVARDPDPDTYGKPREIRKPKDLPPRRVTRFFSRLDSEGWIFDRPNRVLVIASDGTTLPRVLTPGPYQADGITWSPDSTKIAFSSARHDTWDLDWAIDLFTVPANGSEPPERVTQNEAQHVLPSWSPDGTRLAFLRFSTPLDEPRHFQVGVIDLGTGQRSELTSDLDRNCAPYGSARAPVWAGVHLLFSVEDEGNIHVYSVRAEGDGKPEPLAAGRRWVHGWDWASGTLAMAISTPTSFPEIVTKGVDFSDGAGTPVAPLSADERKHTNLSGAFVSHVKLVEPIPYTATSVDGTEVPCWAMSPVDAEPGRSYPTLLNVHGGPFTSYGNTFFDEFQVEVGAGFGVIFCNPRGSSGYSEAWGRAVRWPDADPDPGSGWGGVDFEDVMACVEGATARFSWVDPDRLGIIGGSYGGFMASWAIGHTDRFKAAISERACNNLLSLEINSDIATLFRCYVGHTHLEDPQAYLSRSPITFVNEMTTPVLILHSEEDYRCPINQAEELFVALRVLGREPEMVRFPGESHELSRSGAPRHRIARFEIILDWFKNQLGT